MSARGEEGPEEDRERRTGDGPGGEEVGGAAPDADAGAVTGVGTDTDTGADGGTEPEDPAVGEDEDTEPAEDLPPAEPWRRLSPRMLVAAPVTYMKNFIVPLALIAFGATQNPWVLGSLFAALVGMVATGV